MHSQRPGRRAGGGILRDPSARRKHSRLPARTGAREAVDREIRRQLEWPEVGPQTRDLVLRAQADVDVSYAVVVELDRQLRPLDAECREQFRLRLVRLNSRDRLFHPPEDDPIFLAFESHRDDPVAGLEAKLRSLQRPGEDERRSECGMTGKRELGERREDADPRVPARLGRQHKGHLREVDLARERLHRLVGDPATVGEDGELISLERCIGEDVADDVPVVGHCRDRCRGRRPWEDRLSATRTNEGRSPGAARAPSRIAPRATLLWDGGEEVRAAVRHRRRRVGDLLDRPRRGAPHVPRLRHRRPRRAFDVRGNRAVAARR